MLAQQECSLLLLIRSFLGLLSPGPALPAPSSPSPLSATPPPGTSRQDSIGGGGLSVGWCFLPPAPIGQPGCLHGSDWPSLSHSPFHAGCGLYRRFAAAGWIHQYAIHFLKPGGASKQEAYFLNHAVMFDWVLQFNFSTSLCLA